MWSGLVNGLRRGAAPGFLGGGSEHGVEKAAGAPKRGHSGGQHHGGQERDRAELVEYFGKQK